MLSWVELLYRRQWVRPPAYLDFSAGLRHSKCVGESWQKRKGVGCALLAAVLFGLSTPLAKSVSPLVQPSLLAGLLYLGSGIGLGLYLPLQLARRPKGAREASLKRADAPWLAGSIVACGMVGPLLPEA